MSAHAVVQVHEVSQPSAARRLARQVAAELGFGEEDGHRVGIIATELATNLVKHTTGGEILLRGSATPAQLEILALDRGPGMGDIARSMEDGHSTSGSPGTGLGAARRLADEFDIYSQPGQGTAVLARVRPRRSPPASKPPLDASGVSVAARGETACGDAWLVRAHPGGPIAAVADGLGHGPNAAEASQTAMTVLAAASFTTLIEALALLHDALRHTRGAALSLLQVDARARVVRYAGVGNVTGAICHNGQTRRAVSLNGTLGHQARTFREFSYPWAPDALFVMCSDGLISHWSLSPYPGLTARQPALVAAVLYRDFWRGRDDVTVLVGREVA